jgi:hypothetical protein
MSSVTGHTASTSITQEEFCQLAREWDACEYVLNATDDASEFTEASEKQRACEERMDASPWKFDGEGNVIPKHHVSDDEVTHGR